MDCLTPEAAVQRIHGGLAPQERSEVDLHLAACDSCRGLLASLARAELSSGRSAPAPGVLETRVDRFHVLELLGAGAMGVTYAAYDPKLDRRVCLKLLHDARGTSGEELLREARAMARLTHPNVIGVHDAGTWEGRVYLVMEYASGGSLRQWLNVAPRSSSEVLERFLAAGRGLAAAHEVGIVHRDFKPANVVIREDGNTCVADFGLARTDNATQVQGGPLSRGPNPGSSITLGPLVGTPAYMSPEQLSGAPADARSDQFSFCVALYEGLFGNRPFAGATLEELLHEIQQARLKRPARDEGAPPLVWNALVRGLACDPQARFPSMEALLHALRPSSRKRIRTLGAAAALGLAAAAAGVAWWPAHRCAFIQGELEQAWSPARRPALIAAFSQTGAPHAQEVANRVIHLLDGYAAKWLSGRHQLCVANSWHLAPSTHELAQATCFESSRQALGALSDVLLTGDATVVAQATIASQSLPSLSVCSRPEFLNPSPLSSDRSGASALERMMAQGNALMNVGKLRQAEPVYEAAVQKARLGGDGPSLARALYAQGALQSELENNSAAHTLLSEAAATALAAGDDRTAALSWMDMANIERQSSGDTMKWLRFADAAFQRIHSPPDLRGRLEGVWANAESDAGHLAAALPHARQSVASKVLAFGPDDLRVAFSEYNLGIALLRAGDLHEGLQVSLHARDLFERAFGVDQTRLSRVHRLLGELYEGLGQYGAALASYQRYYDATKSDARPGDVRLLQAQYVLEAERCLFENNPAHLSRVRDVYQKLQAALEKSSTSAAGLRSSLASLLLQLGRPAEALPLFEESVAMLGRAVGPDNLMTGQVRGWLGQTLLALGRSRAAAASLTQALSALEKGGSPVDSGLTAQALARAESAEGASCASVSSLYQRAAEAFGHSENNEPFVVKARSGASQWLREHPSGSCVREPAPLGAAASR